MTTTLKTVIIDNNILYLILSLSYSIILEEITFMLNPKETDISNNLGFSLTEVLITAAVVSVFSLAAYQGVQYFQSSSKKVHEMSSSTAETQQEGSHFSQLSESANIALKFQHLPIPFNNCSADGPCVRQIESNTIQALSTDDVSLLSQIKPNGSPLQSIEFYRDESATLFTDPNNSNLRKSSPIILPNKFIGTNYYATWPLSSETSKPFVIMKQRTDITAYFALEKATSGLAITKINKYAVFHPYFSNSNQTTAPTSDQLKSLLNSMVVVYNSKNPDFYTVKVISETPKACFPDGKTPIEECTSILKPCTSSSCFCSDCIAVLLSDVKNFDPYSPDLNPAPTTWGTQRIYTFPTDYFSVQPLSPTNTEDDLAPPADVRKLSHFFDGYENGKYNADSIFMIPITVSSYFLRKMNLPGNQLKYSLVSKTYSGNGSLDPEIIVADSLATQSTPSSSSPSPSPSASPSASPTSGTAGKSTSTSDTGYTTPAAIFLRKLGTTEMGIILNSSR